MSIPNGTVIRSAELQRFDHVRHSWVRTWIEIQGDTERRIFVERRLNEQIARRTERTANPADYAEFATTRTELIAEWYRRYR